jgi:FkbM family methyltransferase
MSFRIFYGTSAVAKDVTDICFSQFKNGNQIVIPSNDFTRSKYFADPVPGVQKNIFIARDVTEHDVNTKITIDLDTEEVNSKFDDSIIVEKKLREMQSKLMIRHGSFNEEFPEQMMATKYLQGHEKVLEIGGNIGRNSLIIAQILREKNVGGKLVTLECSEESAKCLAENRKLNKFDFAIEVAALSKKKLIQQGWNTMVSDEVFPGFTPVNIISWEDLENKHNITFDTLVLDCEGAFFFILQDFPNILEHISLIIMENDYYQIEKKQFVDEKLRENGFSVDYSERGGWGPCEPNFFEVWKKN